MSDESTNKIKSKVGRPRSGETRFAKWLDEHPDWPRVKIAEELGVTLRYVNDLCSGRRNPSRLLMKSVERLTNGEFKEEFWEKIEPQTELEKVKAK